MNEQNNFNQIIKEKTPGERFLEHDYLTAGKKIKLKKVFGNNESIEGILDFDVKQGKPIIMDNGSKNIDSIINAQLLKDKIFLKTADHTYELVPPTDAVAKTRPNSEELIKIDNEIESELKRAQASALSMQEAKILFVKKQNLSLELNKTPDIQDQIKEIETKLKACTVVVDTLLEFKILMEKTSKNYYIIRSVIEHENAHSNKASSLEVIHGGYSVLVLKNKEGVFSYLPTARTKPQENWDDKRKIETNIKIGRAPEEYGNRMSDGDKENVAKLREQLENLNEIDT